MTLLIYKPQQKGSRARRLAAALAASLACTALHAAEVPHGASATQSQRSSPFGPNVFVLNPRMSRGEMQAEIDRVYAQQQQSEFGDGRFAFLLAPGEYHLDIPIGFYTQVLGLGATPDEAHVTGNVHVDAAGAHNNATTTFWRGAEGFAVTPTDGTLQWAVSQAVSFRRMHVLGDMVLHQKRGWASGGWMSDTKVDGNVDSGTQQQWISRNSEWKSWTGSNWNMVFMGDRTLPAGNWPDPPYTKLAQVPLESEKPYLQIDSQGQYSVFVPALRKDSVGMDWKAGNREPAAASGHAIPLEHFYIARPEKDSAASINAALAAGRDLLLTPGIYNLVEPLRITRKDSVVLGLGFATLRPTQGSAAMLVADVDGVSVSGVLFDAGPQLSPSLLQVGAEPGHRSHAADPITLHDVFFRVGGAGPGKTVDNLVINSDDVIIDHTWIWRADHGAGVGWTRNLSAHGLVVNGNNVSAYGLFVEHHQQFQVLWNGENGRTFFYQSEIPYDPPDQRSWSSAPGVDGWASYKVADNVNSHEAWGLGVYSVFLQPSVRVSHAIEVPKRSGVCFEHMITVALDKLGEISSVIDNVGAAATTQQPRLTPKVNVFPTDRQGCVP